MNLSKEYRLTIAVFLGLLFLGGELAGGIISNSLAVISDAAHLSSDVFGFVIALIATKLAKTEGTAHFTFGYARVEVFSALISITMLWGVTIWLVVEATNRIILWSTGRAEKVDGKLMFIIACIGVGVNLILGFVFHEDHGGSDLVGHGHSHEHHQHHRVDTDTLLETDHANSSSRSAMIEIEGVVDIEKSGCVVNAINHDHDHNHQEVHNLIHTSDDNHAHVHAYNHNYDHAHNHNHSNDHDHDHSHCSDSPHQPNPATTGVGAHHHDHDVNMHAAFLHVLTDLVQSIGVAIGGAIIWAQPTWQIADALCTLFFSLLVLYSTSTVIRRIVYILAEASPPHIELNRLRQRLLAIENVIDVHDLHVWNLSSNAVLFSCHILSTPCHNIPLDEIMRQAHKVCEAEGIDHATIQVQRHHQETPSSPSLAVVTDTTYGCCASSCQSEKAKKKIQCHKAL